VLHNVVAGHVGPDDFQSGFAHGVKPGELRDRATINAQFVAK
jgi:hypothetical protein